MGGRDGLSLVGERPAAHRVVDPPLFFSIYGSEHLRVAMIHIS